MPAKNQEKEMWPIVTGFWGDPNKPGNFFSKPLNDKFKENPTAYDTLMKHATEGSSLYLRKAKTAKGTTCYYLCIRPPYEKTQNTGRKTAKNVTEDDDLEDII